MDNLITMIGFILIFMGFIVLMAGMLLSVLSGESREEVKGGGIIFIGPIPIAFGTDTKSVMFIAVIMLILMFVYLAFITHS